MIYMETPEEFKAHVNSILGKDGPVTEADLWDKLTEVMLENVKLKEMLKIGADSRMEILEIIKGKKV